MIFELKLANRYMVEAIKDSRGLHRNITTYMSSDNEHIRYEYDQLRRKVAKVLRRIYRLRVTSHPERRLTRLLALKYRSRQSDVLVNGRLDEIIRKNLIDSEMATSLANDSDNVAGITRNLIRVAELLYVHADTILTGVTELSDSDLEKLSEAEREAEMEPIQVASE